MTARSSFRHEARETLWEFDAVDLRPVLRWLDEGAENLGVAISPTGSASHVDVYFDTDDRRFHRAGYARSTGLRAARDQTGAGRTVERGNLPIRLPSGCVDCRDPYFA
jgi:hypothetical protein